MKTTIKKPTRQFPGTLPCKGAEKVPGNRLPVMLQLLALPCFMILLIFHTGQPVYAQPCPVTANAGGDKVVCYGTAVNLVASASGGSGIYTYSWSGGGSAASKTVSPASTTTYTVTISDGSCSATDNVIVHVLPKNNLLANGDFEDITSPPQVRGDIEKANGWKKLTGDADLFDDNFTMCDNPSICGTSPADIGCIGIPCNHFGNLAVNTNDGHNGSKYAGLWAAGAVAKFSSVNAVKYLYEGIGKPVSMVKGKQYKISFWIALAPKGEIDDDNNTPYITAGIADFSVILSTNPKSASLTYDRLNPVTADKDKELTGSVNTTAWTLYSTVITADSNYNYIYIQSDTRAISVSIDTSPVKSSFQSYMYLDDVQVEEMCTCTAPSVSAGPDKAICKGQSVAIGGSPTAAGGTAPYTYQWTPNYFISSTSTANPTVTPDINKTYVVSVSDAQQCLAIKDTVVVRVSNMSLYAGPDRVICHGNQVTIGGIATGGIGNYSYSWSPSAGLSNATVAQPAASPTATATYIVTVTDSAGCSTKDTVVVTVNPNPTANAGPDYHKCHLEGQWLNGSGSGGTNGPYAYEWRLNGNIVGNGSSYKIDFVTATESYVLKVTDGHGCYDTDTAVIFAHERPALNTPAHYDYCLGTGPLTIGGTASGGTPTYKYSWSGLASTTPTITITPTTSAKYTEIVVDSFNCSAAVDIIVEVRPSPVANAGSNFEICNGTTEEVGAVHPASGGTAPYSYSWTSNTGTGFVNSPPHTQPNPKINPSTTTLYRLLVTDAYGCTAKDSATVSVINCTNGDTIPQQGTCGLRPKADAGPDWTGCAGSSHQLGGSPTGKQGTNLTYSWTPVIGLNNTTIANPTVTASGELLRTYRVVITDGCNRQADDFVTVKMTSPTAVAGNNTTLCYGGCAYIGSILDPLNITGTPPLNYSWTASTGETVPSGHMIYVCPATTTTYTLTVTDSLQCSSAASVTFTVLPQLSVNAGPDISLCTSSGDTIIGNTATGGTSPYTYSWSPAPGLSSTTLARPRAYPLFTTEYTVTVTDNFGCQASDKVLISVNPKPDIHAGPDQVICLKDTVTIGNTATLGTPPYSYNWSPTSGLSPTNAATVQASPGITTNYRLIVTDLKSCKDTDNVIVTVRSTPLANAGPDVSVCQGISVNIGNTATGGVAPVTYSWAASPPPNPSATTASITVIPSSTTTYYQTATGANGCDNTDEVTVTVFQNPNQVVNGQFETTVSLPDMRGQADRASGWFKATGDADLFHRNTPNTFCNSIADLECVGIPGNHFGNLEHLGGASSGNAYAGLWAAIGAKLPNERILAEGITTELVQPLKPNTYYELSFYVALGQKAETSVGDGLFNTINLLPEPLRSNASAFVTALVNSPALILKPEAGYLVKFSNTLHNNDLLDLYNLYRPINEPVSFSGSVNSGNWIRKSHVFNSNTLPVIAGKQYIIIESQIPELTLADICPSCSYQTYFYIDSIVLREACPYAGPLTVSAGPDVNICKGSAVTLNAAPAGGAPPYSYKWTPAAGLNNPNSATPQANPIVNTTYTVTVTDANGTTASDAIAVNVNNLPSADAGPDKGVCGGACVTIGGSPTASGGASPYTYTWTASSGTAPTGANPSVCPSATTTYRVIVSDNNGCLATDSTVVEAYSQSEKISNGSFETGAAPLKRGDIANATGWFAAEGTPDLFGTDAPACPVPCGTGPADYNCVGVPCNNLGTESPKEGNRYAGVGYVSSAFVPNTSGQVREWEGIETQFINGPLDVNKIYTLRLHVSRAERGDLQHNGGGQLQQLALAPKVKVVVKMSTTMITDTSILPVAPPIIYSQDVANPNGWTLITHTFQPADPYEFIIIEGFAVDGPKTYMYIDSVSLQEVCGSYSSLSMSQPFAEEAENSLAERTTQKQLSAASPAIDGNEGFEVFPNPNNGRFTLQYDAGGKTELKVSVYNPIGQLISTIQWDQAGAGKTTREISLRPETGVLSPGIYLVLLSDGNKVYSKRISITK